MRFKTLLAASLSLLAVSVVPVANAEVEIGVLTCKSVPGSRVNLLIRSTTDVDCVFKDGAGKSESYQGESGIALGLDLSFKSEETFAFTVISSSTADAGSHALAGKYIGGKASASLGVGLGAAVLVGGSDDNFGLNPIAVGSNQGVGAAAGIGFLYIEAK